MFRSLVSTFMLAIVALTAVAPTAHAGDGRRGYRYRTTYRQWDGGFHRYYGYSESCTTTYHPGWTSSTCYNVAPTDYVYVQEQILDDGRSRVTVYADDNYDKSPFVEYYVQHNEVVYRRYYDGWGYPHDVYYSRSYVTTEWAINWDSGWGKILGGLEVAAIGASIASNGDKASQYVGAGIALSGSISMSFGSAQLKKESDLEKAIKAQAEQKNEATDVLN
ncbi:MAG: hypothetical protein JST04_09550 [Bdellovibrionales bacterium]|nr:hypothetical protein [Bdellovibrionales bacterium]